MLLAFSLHHGENEPYKWLLVNVTLMYPTLYNPQKLLTQYGGPLHPVQKVMVVESIYR